MKNKKTRSIHQSHIIFT